MSWNEIHSLKIKKTYTEWVNGKFIPKKLRKLLRHRTLSEA